MKTVHFWPIAWTLAVFSVVVFTLDVLAGLLFPKRWVMQNLYELLLPGFTLISWGAYFLGTARVIPHHDGVSIPLEEARILWQR